MAVTDTRFCTSKASAPSIATLLDWTRSRACCCRRWAPLLLLLPWPTDTSPLDYVTTISLLESRCLIIWWCTVGVVQFSRPQRDPVVVMIKLIWWRLPLGGRSMASMDSHACGRAGGKTPTRREITQLHRCPWVHNEVDKEAASRRGLRPFAWACHLCGLIVDGRWA